MSLDPTLLIAGDFIVLRMALVDDLDGDMEAAVVLQRMAWRCEREGQWVASHADIQEETRLSERKVRRALATLRERGYITSERASSWDPTLAWSVVLNRPSPDVRNVRHVEDVPPVTLLDVPSVTSSQDSETTTKTKTLPTADAVADAIAWGFGRFWEQAPRKVGKGAAEKAYAKAARELGGSGRIDDAWAASCVVWASWPADRRSFIPHPVTWLNQRRWEDDLPEPASRADLMRQDVAQDGSWARSGNGGW